MSQLTSMRQVFNSSQRIHEHNKAMKQLQKLRQRYRSVSLHCISKLYNVTYVKIYIELMFLMTNIYDIRLTMVKISFLLF